MSVPGADVLEALVGSFVCAIVGSMFAALDAASVRVLRDFLAEAAGHATRTWVVADYEADPRLPWRRQIVLPEGGAGPAGT